ncbi:hypothetical protein CKAH01_19024 [Colletotrichum kahawae]|uniref:Uncharacterized protein n=1 Tax=Colletotrichum kahawae TaxID=34407 RepID=A0AAD9Y3N9_COLKA|nr:hypothetical protein CKAH01_19024 [Colletotrichum kahawae]
MRISRILLLALTSNEINIQVVADDPGFCNNVAVCTPCNCNGGGRCEGFCHHDSGGASTKHCDLQAMGCTCPPSASLMQRRGRCMSVGHRGSGGGKVQPLPSGTSCAESPYYCRWIGNTCVDIRATRTNAAGAKDTKKSPNQKGPSQKGPSKKGPNQKGPT